MHTYHSPALLCLAAFLCFLVCLFCLFVANFSTEMTAGQTVPNSPFCPHPAAGPAVLPATLARQEEQEEEREEEEEGKEGEKWKK